MCWRVGSVVKNIYYFTENPSFVPSIHSRSIKTTWNFSSGGFQTLHGYHLHMWHTAKNYKISILKIIYNFVLRTQKVDRNCWQNFEIISTYFKHMYICILQFFTFLILFSSLHLVLVSGESCHSLSKFFISPRLCFSLHLPRFLSSFVWSARH